jgi:hypothetical protein
VDADAPYALPESFASTGDPVPINPFSPERVRHGLWIEATRIAEEEVSRIKVDSYAALPLSDASDWSVTLVTLQFDAWAKRTLFTVWSDADLQGYDRWLVGYANSWIELRRQFYTDNPPPFSLADMLTDLRKRLALCVEHWKAAGRRYRAAQERQMLESPPTTGAPIEVSDGVVRRRKAMVAAYRNTHELTAVALAQRVGISQSAITGIVRENRKRFGQPRQDQLLTALGITREDWYRE